MFGCLVEIYADRNYIERRCCKIPVVETVFPASTDSHDLTRYHMLLRSMELANHAFAEVEAVPQTDEERVIAPLSVDEARKFTRVCEQVRSYHRIGRARLHTRVVGEGPGRKPRPSTAPNRQKIQHQCPTKLQDMTERPSIR